MQGDGWLWLLLRGPLGWEREGACWIVLLFSGVSVALCGRGRGCRALLNGGYSNVFYSVLCPRGCRCASVYVSISLLPVCSAPVFAQRSFPLRFSPLREVGRPAPVLDGAVWSCFLFLVLGVRGSECRMMMWISIAEWRGGGQWGVLCSEVLRGPGFAR